ncbi:hypothetical protein Q4567_06435 [Aliiglaciecola sp. 2_MG-2023]|uniref:hypothetical protein n=1 Tax=unclassified Aliiglaciecola TaxID=2593648 RepID=UPI0026E29211|nr:MULTISPECIES: hypothetical protein [unclassified Aliiglaciecola]MDO6710348.1 hypothetical protein [Aliiglaciecola sp. 2_MG-2023]MDO6751495.1 hypothetical protein [Aliiglaciecola sp. 1_MG-2023]
MEVINEIKAVITEHRYCSSSELFAQALASACSRDYDVNLFQLIKVLDGSNKHLLNQLINVNYYLLDDLKAQEQALTWLKQEKLIK